MSQSYEIFINDRCLVLIRPNDAKLKEVKSDRILHGKDNLRRALEMCRNGDKNQVYLTGTPEKLMEEIEKIYDVVYAAGGLVVNNKGELLFILRHGIWDLPKGKLEEDENPAEGAKREVEEECGIKNLLVEEYYSTTYHTYQHEGNRPVLKKTLWYYITTDNPGESTPQNEEGITEVKWLRQEELLPILEGTYKNLRYLIEKFLREYKL